MMVQLMYQRVQITHYNQAVVSFKPHSSIKSISECLKDRIKVQYTEMLTYKDCVDLWEQSVNLEFAIVRINNLLCLIGTC